MRCESHACKRVVTMIFQLVERRRFATPPRIAGTTAHGRNTTADSVGKTHCSGDTIATALAPPYLGESLVQNVSHLQLGGGASKGSETGCKTWRSPEFIINRRSSLVSEKYRRTKLAGPRTAPSIPPELCFRNRESSRRNVRRSRCRSYSSRFSSRSEKSSLHREKASGSSGAGKLRNVSSAVSDKNGESN